MDISPPSSQSRSASSSMIDSSNESINPNFSDDDSNLFFEANFSALNEGLGDTEVNKSYSLSANAGYKLVFDNLDKNVKPRHMRTDNQTKSLHFVQSYATRDRVDFSRYSNEAPTEVNAFDVLPTEEDYKSLKADFSTLVSRMMVEHIPFFSTDFKGLPVKHIPHQYSREMSTKSEIVSDNNTLVS